MIKEMVRKGFNKINISIRSEDKLTISNFSIIAHEFIEMRAL